jgi:hypothetical protein
MLPETVVDEVVAFSPDVWAVPCGQEVVVSLDEPSRDDGPAWQVMMWWPLLLEDWVLMGDDEKDTKAVAEAEAEAQALEEAVPAAAPFLPQALRCVEVRA